MKSSPLFAVLALLAVSCSSSHGGFMIHGYVEDPALDGAQVFLVPLKDAVKESIDSVVIKGQKFEFKGTVERMSDIRIERLRRIGTQNLLVVTEPGDIYVTIGKQSSGYGTPQNDSLQVWKQLTENRIQAVRILYEGGMKEQADSINRAYRERTRQMVSNLGEGTLHDFLDGLYPERKDTDNQ